MAPKAIARALKDMLMNLSKADFEDFCHELLDRREEPRVARSRVEGKSRLEVVQVLVSTFTETGALQVALQILRENNCSEAADELVQVTGGQSSQPGSSETARPSAGATGVQSGCTDGQHFVDKYRVQLIDRVCNIPAILDELLDEKVIQQGTYDEILALNTSRDRMRKLYCGALNAAGIDGKEVFYKILEEKETFLIRDLKKNK